MATEYAPVSYTEAAITLQTGRESLFDFDGTSIANPDGDNML